MSSDTPPSIPPRKASGGDRKDSPATGGAPAAGAKPRTGGTGTTTEEPRRTATQATPAAGRTDASAPATAAAPAPSAAKPAASSTATATAPRPAASDTAARTVTTTSSAAATAGGARRVRLVLSRVDPWSVMKLSFLISVAVGIMLVVATAVVWLTLDGLHVFAKIDNLASEILAESDLNLLQYVAFSRVISVATLVGVVDVFLITALSTIGAFLYNITAALVGGVHVTMTDD